MTQFIKNPNLPQSDVTMLICGDMHDEVLSYFKKNNIKVLRAEINNSVDESISGHCDISALYLGDGKIIVDRSQAKLINKLSEEGFYVTESNKNVEGKYPSDVILNHTIIGNKIIGKESVFDEAVKDNISDFVTIDVKQGYSKCSSLVVDDNSVITDDMSIYQKCTENGIECLLIEKGDISLNGHEYGFIGGASGKIAKDTVMFFGDITKHSSFDKINEFLSCRNVKYISFDFPLTDYGGFVPLKEKIT